MKSSALKPRGRSKRIRFDHVFLQIEAVTNGLGFALLSEVLMDQHLRSGVLISPFPETAMSYPNLHALYPQEDRSSPGIRCFMRWLAAEGEKISGDPDDFTLGPFDEPVPPVDFAPLPDKSYVPFE